MERSQNLRTLTSWCLLMRIPVDEAMQVVAIKLRVDDKLDN